MMWERPKAKSPKIDNGTRVKDFSLNKERALKKKAEDCLGYSCISYANKSGNHIRSVWPILFLLNVFTALKGTHLIF